MLTGLPLPLELGLLLIRSNEHLHQENELERRLGGRQGKRAHIWDRTTELTTQIIGYEGRGEREGEGRDFEF